MVVWNSSYELVYGNASDEDKYSFSYFNEFEESSYFVKILEVGILAIIFIISFISNVAVALCFIRYPDIRTVTNNFVLNLAAANIVLALTIPYVGYSYSRLTTSWILGNLTCKLIPYIQFVSSAVILWTLTFISSDSYWRVIIPPYRSNLTTRQAHIHCSITWFVAATVFIPVVLWFRQHQTTQHNRFVCTIIFPKSESPINLSIIGTFPVVTTAFILPIIILIYNYIRIFQKIMLTNNINTWECTSVTTSENLNPSPSTSLIENEPNPRGRHQSDVSLYEIFSPWSRRTSSSHLMSSNRRHGSLSQYEEKRINKHIKLIRILSLNDVLVLVTWTPIIVIMLLICFNGSKPKEDNNYFLRTNYFLSLMFDFFNTLISLFIYGILSDDLRSNLIKMFCSSFVQEDTITENIDTLGNHNNSHSNIKPGCGTSVSEV